MYKYLFRFVVTTITILTANLITNLISDYMAGYRFQTRPLTFTLIAMGIITLIFYPLFTRLEIWIEGFSRKAVKAGNSYAGKYFGLILTFIVAILILTYFYARSWYHIDLLKALFQGRLGKYI
jgi:hypothetical protein